MKILWITNILFPEATSQLVENSDLKSSGGWMLGAAENLVNRGDIKLYVATVSPLVKELTCIEGKRIVYYILPYGKGNLKPNPKYQDYWIKIRSEINPDVVHIHGTEFSHGYEYMRACGVENVVISIQGMKSAYYYYYYYGISKSEIFRNLTFRDVIKGTILKGQRNFKRSSKYEIAMMEMAKHIIGRTSWDRARTWAINPDAQYHFCNETLREEFYDGSSWDYSRCNKHTIFLSQAGYPIKGLHQLLKAMPLILRHYPNTIIRIAGNDISKCTSLKDFLYLTGYGRYINRLIKKGELEDHVVFIGRLNADEMKREYLSANVFVCPSSIENSPNSLGEAQILGVPCMSSYVGGTMDMMDNNTDNLYRFEEIEMLAYKICQIFGKEERQVDTKDIAVKRHNQLGNATMLCDIYKSIVNESIQ